MTDKKVLHIFSVAIFAMLLIAFFVPFGVSGRIAAAVLLPAAAVLMPLFVKKRSMLNSTKNQRTGEPAKNSSYDTHLYKLCDEAGIKHFCMHTLRHTYATRAIEAGVQPKVLQKMLGHASPSTTMERYVHVTDDSMTGAITQFEAGTSQISEQHTNTAASFTMLPILYDWEHF